MSVKEIPKQDVCQARVMKKSLDLYVFVTFI